MILRLRLMPITRLPLDMPLDMPHVMMAFIAYACRCLRHFIDAADDVIFERRHIADAATIIDVDADTPAYAITYAAYADFHFVADYAVSLMLPAFHVRCHAYAAVAMFYFIITPSHPALFAAYFLPLESPYYAMLISPFTPAIVACRHFVFSLSAMSLRYAAAPPLGTAEPLPFLP